VIAMNIQRPSCALAVALIATQALGPAVLWAADQRGIRAEANRQVIVSALSGEQLTLQNSGDTKALRFREAVNPGDHIATGDRTVAEVLIGNRAVVTLGQSTTAQVIAVSETQATVQVQKGSVRVAASAMALGAQGKITVQTPTGQVHTRGGIIRVMVDAPIGSAEQLPIGAAKPYRAAYSPSAMVAAANTRGDIIQVEEGTAEIPSAGPGGGTLTVRSGQAVTMQSGRAGSISGLVNQEGLRVGGVLASAGHKNTPKEGLDNLVALQVDQATALGKALTGAAETGKGDSGKKDDSKNAINGATGGVPFANSAIVASLFGNGTASDPTRGVPLSRTGTGFAGDTNDSPLRLDSAIVFEGPMNNGYLYQFSAFFQRPLLRFSSLIPVEAVSCAVSDCTGLQIVDLNEEGSFGPPQLVGLREGTKIQSTVLATATSPNAPGELGASGELVLIEGRSPASSPHGGVFLGSDLEIRGGTNHPLLEVSGAYGPKNDNDLTFPLKGRFISTNSRVVLSNDSTGALSCGGGSGCNYKSGPREEGYGFGLSDYSERKDGIVYNFEPNIDPSNISNQGDGISYVNAAITASGSLVFDTVLRENILLPGKVTLTGGVALDHGTQATIGTTTATSRYFLNPNLNSNDATFSGSLLAVVYGPDHDVSLAMLSSILGVYNGSRIFSESGNKALLSILDAKLTGPGRIKISELGKLGQAIPLIAIEAGVAEDGVTLGSAPEVAVTSAVVTRSTIALDGALLEATGPLFALTNAKMTTTSHFADLAGNQARSIQLGDALVALNASQLLIQNGNLLNLNAAAATVNGYLFSLTGGSTLTLNNGGLFSLTNGSSLNLTGNAFGVFGNGVNTLSIDNNLCTATCFQLVNSANQPFLLNGMPLHVAGASQNVVLPNNFNVFALAPGASASNANIHIGVDDALFRVDGTSTLTINGINVQ
jgi:hypothetical protein